MYFPNINEQNRPVELFEPYLPSNLTYPKINPSLKLDLCPEFTPDFSEHIDIESSSINLALGTLGISRGEYNCLDIQELKSRRRIDLDGKSINALNVLIYYKQNSNTFLPQVSPNKHKLDNSNLFGNTYEK